MTFFRKGFLRATVRASVIERHLVDYYHGVCSHGNKYGTKLTPSSPCSIEKRAEAPATPHGR